MKKIEKLKKKFEKKNNLKKKQKKEGGITVDYCCNPQWFRCGGIVIPPHRLEYCIIISLFDLIVSTDHYFYFDIVRWNVLKMLI